VPLLPASLIEPLWVEFAALIESDRPEFDPTHPWGCHRRRIPDRVVFDHIIAALVHGSGYERVATAACSDRTICRRLEDRADAGVGEAVLQTTLVVLAAPRVRAAPAWRLCRRAAVPPWSCDTPSCALADCCPTSIHSDAAARRSGEQADPREQRCPTSRGGTAPRTEGDGVHLHPFDTAATHRT
jgi:hypothetical protein